MLEQVLIHLHNWFVAPGGKRFGEFTIENGGIALPFLKDGQYFRIMGSVCNDGLHRYGPDMPALTDETFDGAVWALAVPPAVVELAGSIAAWQTKNGERAMGPYASESLAGQYSYTKATDAQTGGAVTWESAFRSQLNAYRKLRS